MSVYIFERRQRAKISAPTYDLAVQQTEHEDVWDCGEVELIDKLDEETA